MKRYLKELVLLLAVFGGLPFDTMSDTAYAQTKSLRLNGVIYPDGSNAVGGVINVKAPEYNCKGDGVTDDRACIAAAVTAAGSGGVVLLPKSTGSYLISSPLTLANVTVTGEGATIAMTGGYSSAAFLNIGSNVRIHHINISGSVAVGGGVTLIAANANSTHVEIDHVRITGSTTAQGVTMNVAGIADWNIHDNVISTAVYGVLVNNTASDLRGLKIVGNDFSTIYGDGIELNNPIFGTARSAFTAAWNIVVEGNTIDTSSHAGGDVNSGFCVGIAGSDYVNVIGNVCKSDYEGFHVEDSAGAINLIGNTVSSTAHNSGIQVIGGSNVNASNNIIRNAASHGIFFSDDPNHTVSKFSISGNQVDSSGGDGIYISENGTSSHGEVSSNLVTNNATDGIFVGDSAEGVNVVANGIYDNGGCGISMGGTIKFAVYQGNAFTNNTLGEYCFPTTGVTTRVDDLRARYPAVITIAGGGTFANASLFNMQNVMQGNLTVRLRSTTGGYYSQQTFYVRWNGTTLYSVATGDTNTFGPIAISNLLNSSGSVAVKIFNSFGFSLTFDIDVTFVGSIQGGTAGGSNAIGNVGDYVVLTDPTPTVDLSSLKNGRSVRYTLTTNEAASVSSITNGIAGEPYYFEICQSSGAGGTVTWPANALGFPSGIGMIASSCMRFPFTYDGTNYVASASNSAFFSTAGGITGAFAYGTTTTSGWQLANTTASTVGVTEQISPCLDLQGTAWNSTATASQLGDWWTCSRPRTGSTLTAQYSLYSSLNGAAATEQFRFQPGSIQAMIAGTFTFLANIANASNAINFNFAPGGAMSTAGATTLAVATSNASNTGRLRIGLISGAGTGIAAYGEDLTCSGTCTAGEVMCWGGTDGTTVSQCAATANLTTIAGVAMITASNTTIDIARHGRVQVKCDTGTAIGPVGTSGTTAGRVNNTVSTFGALIGHVTKAEASNLCIVNLEL